MSILSRPMRPRGALSGAVAVVLQLLDAIPSDIAVAVMRLAMSVVFWRSGMTKIANWSTTLLLFKNEYHVPLLPVDLAALVATSIELGAPVLLILGLATRLGAAAMLGMALVIQIFVYPEHYPDHLLWIGILLYLLTRGAGAISLDYVLRRHFVG